MRCTPKGKKPKAVDQKRGGFNLKNSDSIHTMNMRIHREVLTFSLIRSKISLAVFGRGLGGALNILLFWISIFISEEN